MFENSTKTGSRIPCGSRAPRQQDPGATLDKTKQKPPSSDDLMLAGGHSLSKDRGNLTIFHQRTRLLLSENIWVSVSRIITLSGEIRNQRVSLGVHAG